MDARRLIPIGAVVTAFLVLAGAASHGRPLRPGTGSGPSAVFFDYVATSFFLFAVALVVVLLFAVRTNRSGRVRPPRGKWHIVTTLLTLAASAALAYFILHSRFEKRLRDAAQSQRAPHGQTQPGAKRTGARDLRGARLRWDEVALVLVVVGGIGIYLFLTREARGELRPLAGRRRAAVSRALDDSIDDLRRDPDLRRAIIAAYARMEDSLARAGVPRAPAEAPYEFLERSLVELEASADAARRLTDLFERAKFSQHAPAEQMRTDAIDALVAVRDELRRPTPEALPA